jgi:NADPH2:quinone reductase
MKAIQIDAFGDPDVLRMVDVAAPAPREGEARIRIAAIGVNFADTERRRGLYDPPALPWIPGHEASGTVELLGPGVDGDLLGRRVAFWSPRSSGAYAELATVPARELFVFDGALPFETLAALPLQGMTAHGVLELCGPLRGRDVLVHAAAGGVGQLLVQLARNAGARVFGVVSTAAKVEAVRSLGASAFLSGDDWVARVRAATGGRGVDAVLDSVGAATRDGSLAALAPRGQLIFFGEASGAPAPIDVNALYERSLRVGALGLNVERDQAHWDVVRRELVGQLARGELQIHVTQRYPLAEAAAAHRALEARATMGKVVLLPAGAGVLP